MCLDYGSWCSEPFRLYDEDEFVHWIRQWPEVDFELSRDGIAKLYPAWDLEYAPTRIPQVVRCFGASGSH